MGGSSPNSDFFFFENIVFFVLFFSLYMFQKKIKNWIGGWVIGVWTIRVFLGFLELFQLDKTPKLIKSVNLSFEDDAQLSSSNQ